MLITILVPSKKNRRIYYLLRLIASFLYRRKSFWHIVLKTGWKEIGWSQQELKTQRFQSQKTRHGNFFSPKQIFTLWFDEFSFFGQFFNYFWNFSGLQPGTSRKFTKKASWKTSIQPWIFLQWSQRSYITASSCKANYFPDSGGLRGRFKSAYSQLRDNIDDENSLPQIACSQDGQDQSVQFQYVRGRICNSTN